MGIWWIPWCAPAVRASCHPSCQDLRTLCEGRGKEGKGPALFSVGKMLLTATSQLFSSRCTEQRHKAWLVQVHTERRYLGKGTAQER